MAAITRSGAFLSDDGGSSWTACGQPVVDAVWYGLAADSKRAGVTLAATSRGLFRSTDGCTSWRPVGGGLDQGTVSVVISNPQHAGDALAAQYGRIFQTTDGGQILASVRRPGAQWRLSQRPDGASRGSTASVRVVSAPWNSFHLYCCYPKTSLRKEKTIYEKNNAS